MSSPYYITDVPLPISENFNSLKDEALAIIQTNIGTEWTNLNPGDPGITILDQLCYALTELGYCTSFPMADILTGPRGKINFRDQFYLPENILTTAPVNATDYRKYLIDAVPDIGNAIFIPSVRTFPVFTGIYNVYLFIDPQVTDPERITNICKAAFFYLNESRNLGEIFIMPVALKPKKYLVKGILELEKQGDMTELVNAMQNKLRQYIFPVVRQNGYNSPLAKKAGPDEVFDGPNLPNGWIATGELGEKHDLLNTITLGNIMSSVSGVKTVSNLSFKEGNIFAAEARCKKEEVLDIDLITSIAENFLQVYIAGVQLNTTDKKRLIGVISKSVGQNPDLLYGAKADAAYALPGGVFRDINSYYSIQNTFPEIFAVGENSLNEYATDFQIAQSRQLKGYLTLFDQVLANQFSQLANVDKLFSFKNTMTGTPSDRKLFYDAQGITQRAHAYPVPYKFFSPTYFYQSVYNIPYIRPLLKNYESHRINFDPGSDKLEEENGWKAYKLDPYNPYIHGLMEMMEDDETSMNRRNAILDHLLARHGESPEVIDAIIQGSTYSGDDMKDSVIFKSLYLQNLDFLSYNRQKAYNFMGADPISGKLPDVTKDYIEKLSTDDFTDFIFNAEKVSRLERLEEKDFVAYSGVELKMSLLLGLKTVYKDFIVNKSGDPAFAKALQMALWMIEQRKGVIMIETGLLFSVFEFELFISPDPHVGEQYRIADTFSFTEIQHRIQEMAEFSAGQMLQVAGAAGVARLGEQALLPASFKTIPGTEWYFSVRAKTSDEIFSGAFKLPSVMFIFPSFVDVFRTPWFKQRLDLFLSETLPVQVTYGSYLASEADMMLLIPAYAEWHKILRGTTMANTVVSELSPYASDLLGLIKNLERM